MEKGIIQKWMENDWLVIVEGLDDLYWMYSTVRTFAGCSLVVVRHGEELLPLPPRLMLPLCLVRFRLALDEFGLDWIVSDLIGFVS